MSRARSRSTLVTVVVAAIMTLLGGWFLVRSTLVDRMLGQPDAWALLPVLFMALRLFVIVAAPPLTVIALGSLLWAPEAKAGVGGSLPSGSQPDADERNVSPT